MRVIASVLLLMITSTAPLFGQERLCAYVHPAFFGTVELGVGLKISEQSHTSRRGNPPSQTVTTYVGQISKGVHQFKSTTTYTITMPGQRRPRQTQEVEFRSTPERQEAYIGGMTVRVSSENGVPHIELLRYRREFCV
jgi:hypothetical protein